MRRWIILFLLAITAAAQDSPPEPTFRTGTELVQLSVVAQDKNGKAVADLRREDFQIFDNGAQQEIACFWRTNPLQSRRSPSLLQAFSQIRSRPTPAPVIRSCSSTTSISIPARTVFAYTARARKRPFRRSAPFRQATGSRSMRSGADFGSFASSHRIGIRCFSGSRRSRPRPGIASDPGVKDPSTG